MTDVHLIAPPGIDDPARPSGGNRYDDRVRAGLEERGRTVTLHEVNGSWPEPDGRSLAALRDTLAAIPSGAAVLVDGLVGCLAAGRYAA